MNEERRVNEKTEPTKFEYGHLYSTFYHIKSYHLRPEKYSMVCVQEKEIVGKKKT